MSEKPTLHEIAAMPFPASLMAMRKHYNPEWGKAFPEATGEMRLFSVKIEYETRSSASETYEVEAASEAEAEKIAENRFYNDCGADDEILEVIAKDITQ